MAIDVQAYHRIREEVQAYRAGLVAVSKRQPASAIRELAGLGQLDFGENYVQELGQKHQELDGRLRWHFIGHLQSNKVKMISPFVHLIHGVSTASSWQEIQKQAMQQNRKLSVLIQVHIAQEDSKSGLDPDALMPFLRTMTASPSDHLCVRGLMGMATLTDDEQQIAREFSSLRRLFEQVEQHYANHPNFKVDTLSMGMTADYKIALAEGSTLIRVGSAIFGERTN